MQTNLLMCVYVYKYAYTCFCCFFSVELAILLTFRRFVFITFYSFHSLESVCVCLYLCVHSFVLSVYVVVFVVAAASPLAINTNLQHFRMFTRDFS